MTFFERDSEMRRVQLMKDIAIAEAEEQAIREVLKEERQDEIKQETTIKLEPIKRAVICSQVTAL